MSLIISVLMKSKRWELLMHILFCCPFLCLLASPKCVFPNNRTIVKQFIDDND